MIESVKVRLLCSLAGADVLPAGTVIETSIKEATSLISHGYAELVEEIETAMSKAAPQTADRRHKKRRGKK